MNDVNANKQPMIQKIFSSILKSIKSVGYGIYRGLKRFVLGVKKRSVDANLP